MATNRRSRRGPPPAERTLCDGPCGIPFDVNGLVLFAHAAYCRSCIAGAAAAKRAVVDAAGKGDAEADAMREADAADYLASPRPWTRSASLVRRYMGLEDGMVSVSSEDGV